MAKLYLSEFVRYSEFEDVFFEGIYDDPWGKETAKWDARHGKTGPHSSEPLPVLPYEPQPVAQPQAVEPLQPGQPIELAQPLAQPVDPAKDALITFIVNQLPNVRLDPNRMDLKDIVVKKNGGNLATALAKPEMIDFARMLDRNVRGWMSTLKGPLQQQMTQLLVPFRNNITQLIKTVLPDATLKVKEVYKDELK
ncbi:MAG: hypothetical protein JHC33_05640 [Ignisphaera sp.]|nr:hypothetical protein [Ignisphaera sp.]